MNWKRTARWSWLILPFLLLALWPGVAAAQLGVAGGTNALLYEVTETLKLKPLAGGHGLSTASLMGTVNAGTAADPNPICPPAVAGADGKCDITAIASRNISLATGKGPVGGMFSVVIQGVNPVDGPELEILRGTLHGKINLSLALLGPDGIPGNGDELPLGTIKGRWRARGVKGGPMEGVHVRGTFEGTFRLPFVFGLPDGCLDDGNPSDCLFVSNPSYLGAANTPVDVQFNELSLFVPTVRLEVKFEEKEDD